MRCLLMIVGLSLTMPLALGQEKEKPKSEGGGFYGVTISTVGKLVLVSSVFKNTVAEKVARRGDLLLQLDDKPILGVQNMIEMIKKRRPGAPAKFLVLRGDKQILIRIKLGKRPENGANEALSQKLSTLELELVAYYGTNPSAQAAWGMGLAAHRKETFERGARYMAFCQALAVHSEMIEAKGSARGRLARLAARAGLMLRANRSAVRLPENQGQTTARLKAELARIDGWIRKLGDGRYAERQRASQALVGLGERARDALTAAAQSRNLEVRWRAQQLLAGLDKAQGERALRMTPALYLAAGGEGAVWRLDRKAGPALKAGVVYRAVLIGGPQQGKQLTFVATGPRAIKLKSGVLLRKGSELMFLVLDRRTKADQ